MRLTAGAAATTAPALPAAIRLRATLSDAALRGARLALYAGIVLSPFRARFTLESHPLGPVFTDYRDSLLFWSEICVLVVLGLWLVSLLLQPRRLDFGPALVRAPALLVLALVWLSVPFSVDAGVSLYSAVVVSGFAILVLYVLNEVRDLRELVPALVLMVLVQAVVGVGQLLTQKSLGLQFLGEFDLRPEYGGTSVVWPDGHDRLLRAYSLTDHPNILGGTVAFASLLLLAVLPKVRRWLRPFLIAVFAAGVLVIFASFSRSAALALATGAAVSLLLLLLRRDRRSAGLWVVACLVALIAVAPFLWHYRAYVEARSNPTAPASGSVEERSITERGVLFERTRGVIADNPWLGVGISGLPTEMYARYPDSHYDLAPAHVVLLTVAAETGVAGAVAYGALVLAPMVLLWRRRDRLTPELIGATGVLVAVHVVGLFDYYTWTLVPGRFWFWLALAAWLVAYRRATTEPPVAVASSSTLSAGGRPPVAGE